MKSKTYIICIINFLLISSALAKELHGGMFVEPSITYEFSDTSVDYPFPISSSKGENKGLGVGARLGIHLYEIFFAGAEGRYSMPEFSDRTIDYQSNAVSTNWAGVIGVQMPDIGLRVWGAYIIDGQLNPNEDNGLDFVFKNATGFRVGAGFRVSSVSINLEYQDLKYASTTLEQIGPFAPSTDFSSIDLDTKTWIASVSFPFEI